MSPYPIIGLEMVVLFVLAGWFGVACGLVLAVAMWWLST